MNHLRIALYAIAVLTTPAKALSVKNALTAELYQLGYCIRQYHENHNKLPESWEDIETISGGIDWDKKPHQLRKRIAFVRDEIVIKGYPSELRVVAITREPFRPKRHSISQWTGHTNSSLGNLGYTVLFLQGRNIVTRHYPPDKAAAIFAEAGAQLPEPSGLGLYPHEIEARTKAIIRWVLGIVSVLFGAFVIIRINQKTHPLHIRPSGS
jgi:hypothetical protein